MNLGVTAWPAPDGRSVQDRPTTGSTNRRCSCVGARRKSGRDRPGPAVRDRGRARASRAGGGGRRGPARPAPDQFRLGYVERERPGRDVHRDRVAVGDERERAEGRGLGGGVQESAKAGAAHPGVGDPDQIGDPSAAGLAGIGMMPHCGVPGTPTRPPRPAPARCPGHVERRVLDPAAHLLVAVEARARPRWRSSAGVAAEVLITAPSGAETRGPRQRPHLPKETPAGWIAPEAGGAALAISAMVAPVTVTAPVSIRRPSPRNRAGTPPARWRSGGARRRTAPRRPGPGYPGRGVPGRRGAAGTRPPGDRGQVNDRLGRPPMVCSIRMAFAKAAGSGWRTAAGPGHRLDRAAAGRRGGGRPRGYPAGIVAEPGIISPSVSARIAMVEAVPIVLQVPVPQARQRSSYRQPASSRQQARRSSQSRHRSLPVPMRGPRKSPAPGAAGNQDHRQVRAARAHDRAGHRLVQAASSTIPSSG